MWDTVILVAVAAIVFGLLWGLVLAFKHSTIMGVLTVLSGLAWVPVFLLMVRPEGNRKPLGLIVGGLVLALLANALK